MRLHTVVERVGDAVDPGVQIRLFVCVEVHVPVALHLEFAVLVGEVVRRRQLVNALEEGFVAGRVLEGEVVFQRCGVEDFLEVGVAQEALDLRAEQQRLAHLRIVQGLDAEEIPCAEQRLFLLIPDDKGEHAPQLIQQLGTVFPIAVDQNFGVGLCGEMVALFHEACTDFLIVVDLAVEH